MIVNKTQIEIIRRDLGTISGYDYKIVFSKINDNRIGTAKLTLKQVEDYKTDKYYKTDNIYQECLKRGLKSKDIIGHLRMFYPNGSWAGEHLMRNGVGSFVLKKIEEDLLNSHGKIMYVFTTTLYMENFLIKHKFTQCSIFKNQFYRTVQAYLLRR
jgi:hypothetical protein